jgi:hypothetical protein
MPQKRDPTGRRKMPERPTLLVADINTSLQPLPSGINAANVLKSECFPLDFIKAIASPAKEAWAVIWPTDPYWGNSRDRDKGSFGVLDPQSDSYGLLFACLAASRNSLGPPNSTT